LITVVLLVISRFIKIDFKKFIVAIRPHKKFGMFAFIIFVIIFEVSEQIQA